MKVPIGSILGHLEIEELDLADEEIITEALVIIRTVAPDRDCPATCYTGTLGMEDDAVRLGALQIVTDHIRDTTRRGWAE